MSMREAPSALVLSPGDKDKENSGATNAPNNSFYKANLDLKAEN